MTAFARRVFAPIGVVLWLSSLAAADGPDHAIVAGFERFQADAKPDAVRGGLLLLGELNCTSCHVAGDAAQSHIAKKQSPILDGVGGRVKVEWLRKFLANPQTAKPGTTMPDLLAKLPQAERDEATESLVQFLATTGKTLDKPIDRKRIRPGSTLYAEIGCAVCHGPRDGSPIPTGSVPLPDLTAKYSLDSLRAFLAKPHDVRPSGRMPSLNLDENAAWEIANFLRQDAQGKSTESLAFRAYEGEWTKLPDFDGMKPVKIGNSAGFDLANSPRNKGFAMRFEGFVRIDREDEYSFMLSSDDGSMLWVDGRRVVDNDGIHPNQSAVGRVKLSPGFHKLVVGYFDGGGEVELAVEIESRDMPRQSIDPYLSLTDAPAVRKAKDEPIAFVADPARSERGRALFSSLGCASCHQLKRDGKPIESTLATKDLDAVNPAAGCLAPTPSAGSPKYALDAGQKSALSAAVKVLAAKPAPPSPTESIARTLTTFNCYGCHARNGEGGVEESRKFLFATTYQDLGEEGRIPPSLNGVGTKITPKYLDELLANGAKDRPYMNTRMPKFGAGNVGALASHLIAIDATTPIAKAELTGPEKKEKSIGRHLVGTQAFGCVQCHNFRGERSAGIPALDMSSMTRRLNHDWFVRYLVDPQAYRPGTRMPSSWPKPESQLTDILDGNSRKQMEAVWLYLSDGSNANPPFGIGRSPIPLVADKNAVIYRAFIQGAGTRGIGVGLPEKVNYAFDANEGRIAMIWQGAFMDAAKHWIGRGEGFQPPLGDDILHLHDGPTIAKLADERQPWPRSDRASDLHKFQGYRISSDNRPTFRYQAGTIAVEDSPNGVAAQGKAAARIRRTLALTSAGNEPNVWYRAAVGATIEPTGDGWYKIDGEWSTKVEGGAEPIVRLSGGKAELIAPVKFSGGKATVTQTYQW